MTEKVIQITQPIERTILRRPAVERRTGLTKSALYALVKKGEFPQPTRLTARSVGWDSMAVQAWIEHRVNAA